MSDELIRKLHDDGMPDWKIARELGIEKTEVTWADVPQGSYPNMTGGMSVRDYLKQARGED